MRRPALFYISILVLGFVLTGIASDRLLARDESYKYLSNFSDTLDLIQKNYVEETNLSRLLDGAYHGLVDELDADSFYLDPKGLKKFQDASAARGQVGIGADVSKRHGYAFVVATLAGSPAAAQLATGDYIRVIDGDSTRAMSVFEIQQRLLGAAGSEVKLKVVKRDTLETKELKIARAATEPAPLAQTELPGDILLLHPARVDEAAVKDIAVALRSRPQTKSVVLDLRGCSQGLLADGARLADLFLDSGTLVRLNGKVGEAVARKALSGLSVVRSAPTAPVPPAGGGSPAMPSTSPSAVATATATASPRPAAPRTGYELRVEASPANTIFRGPLAILSNLGTAGAAEIAAAALKDAGRAPVVGSRTFGRVSVPDLIRLEDGAFLHLTIAMALTPRGTALLGKGLEPDEVVEQKPGEAKSSEGRDPVLEKALERLQKTDGRQKKAA